MKRETTALPCTLPPSVFLTTPSHSSLLSSPAYQKAHSPFPTSLSLSLSLCAGWHTVNPTRPQIRRSVHLCHHLHCHCLAHLYRSLSTKRDRSAGCLTNILLLMLKFQIILLNISLSATHPPPKTHPPTQSSVSVPVLPARLTPHRAHCCGKDDKTKRADSAVIILNIAAGELAIYWVLALWVCC